MTIPVRLSWVYCDKSQFQSNFRTAKIRPHLVAGGEFGTLLFNIFLRNKAAFFLVFFRSGRSFFIFFVWLRGRAGFQAACRA